MDVGENVVSLGQSGMDVSVKTREQETQCGRPVPWIRSVKPIMAPRQYLTKERWNQGRTWIIIQAGNLMLVQASLHFHTIHQRSHTVSVEILFSAFSTSTILKSKQVSSVSRVS